MRILKRIGMSVVRRVCPKANYLWNKYLSRIWRASERIYHTDLIRNQAGVCGDGIRVNGPIVVSAPRVLTIGQNVHIGSGCHFRCEGGIIIGDNTHISRDVTIYSDNHQYQGTALPYDATAKKKPVIIERNVWIGMGVKIRPGVSIGEGAIVGIGTVVTRDIMKLEVVGAPAPSKIRMRDTEHYDRLDKDERYGAANGVLWSQGHRALSTRRAGDGSNMVFVCSTGRSGSQSIAKVFNHHPEIEARHEPNFSLIRLSTEYAHGLKSAGKVKRELLGIYDHASTVPAGKPIYMESDQKLSNLVPLLHELFPKAKFLWLTRNGRDVVASTYARGWFSDSEYEISTDGNYGKRGVYSEFRVDGSLADPCLNEAEWLEMSAFERCCWYWSFWNNEIRKNFA